MLNIILFVGHSPTVVTEMMPIRNNLHANESDGKRYQIRFARARTRLKTKLVQSLDPR